MTPLYDSYVKTLLSSLKCALEIAQRHSSSEQRYQTRQYKNQVKGTYLFMGDHVLVVNKGERGRRKLVDKWEDKVYSVVDVNPNIHVYKISDREGHTKIVHKNLLLDVNFLPIPDLHNKMGTTDFSLLSEPFHMDSSIDTASVSRTGEWSLNEMSGVQKCDQKTCLVLIQSPVVKEEQM